MGNYLYFDSHVILGHFRLLSSRIDLFGSYVLFSQFRPCDTLHVFSTIHMHVDARASDDIWKKQFTGAPSRALEWKNKTYELKRSIGLVLEFFGWVPCYWWLKTLMNGKTSFNKSGDMVVSWLARLDVRDIPVILSVLASLHNGLTSPVKEKKTALVYLETTWHLPIPLFRATSQNQWCQRVTLHCYRECWPLADIYFHKFCTRTGGIFPWNQDIKQIT